jgi:hypothetical protein
MVNYLEIYLLMATIHMLNLLCPLTTHIRLVFLGLFVPTILLDTKTTNHLDQFVLILP